MQSTNVFTLPPKEDNMDIMTRPYEFKSLEYQDAWNFHELLKVHWPYINYSDIFEDVVLKGGLPETSWNVFFDVRPVDVGRLEKIMYRFPNAKLGYCYIDTVLPWD